MIRAHLSPPGIVVNRLRGDAAEQRAHGWLAWDGAEDLDVAVVGAPFDGASTVRGGSRHGPDAVRAALAYYTTYSSESGNVMSDLRCADIGDVTVVTTDMPGTFKRISEVARDTVSRGTKLLTIGGDHSISWPLIEGVCASMSGRKLGVIHFDAHHDLRESHFGAESSGVPFRKALNFPGTPIRGRNLVQLGMTEFSNSPTHAAYAREMGVTVIPGLTLLRDGVAPAIERALTIAADGTDAIYVSIDVDCIDQSQAPGTASPNACGIDARDLYLGLRRLARDPKVVAADIVEISPPLDLNNMTGNVGAMLVLSFLMGVQEGRAMRPSQARARS